MKLSTGRNVVVAPGGTFQLDAPGLVYVSHAGTEYKTARSTLHLVPFERLRKLNP